MARRVPKIGNVDLVRRQQLEDDECLNGSQLARSTEARDTGVVDSGHTNIVGALLVTPLLHSPTTTSQSPNSPHKLSSHHKEKQTTCRKFNLHYTQCKLLTIPNSSLKL